MADKKLVTEPRKIVTEPKKPDTANNLFGRENYIWIIAGIAIIALGLILMAGGRSSDPNVFDPKEVYSTTRITIAPILILLGLGMGVFAIFRKPKDS
ncbi:MAG: DUF3098 domain-containing protein [Chitinophagaceae bacterium]|nr:DUF3098 domain-containing protein [Chitinophagaceae bacterium]